MEVSIYIHVRHKGNPKGEGIAMALLEFIDSRGIVHTRKTMATKKDCTNNSLALELTAMALKMLVKPCGITIHTDNKYIESCITLGWLEKWQQEGWVKAGGRPLANLELWKDFYISMQMHEIKFAPYIERQEFNIINKEAGYG